MRSTKFLIQEHKLILRSLDILDAMSASIQRSEPLDERDADTLLDFFRWFADAHHQEKEEAILFPAMKSAAAAEDRPVQHMTVEHERERALISEVETAVRLQKHSEFVSAATRLSALLRNHIQKEDDILFELANEILDPKTDEGLVDRLSRFETPLDKKILDEKLHELHLLEWKYLRR